MKYLIVKKGQISFEKDIDTFSQGDSFDHNSITLFIGKNGQVMLKVDINSLSQTGFS